MLVAVNEVLALWIAPIKPLIDLVTTKTLLLRKHFVPPELTDLVGALEGLSQSLELLPNELERLTGFLRLFVFFFAENPRKEDHLKEEQGLEPPRRSQKCP